MSKPSKFPRKPMSMTKSRIEDIARYHASDLDGRDVARVSNNKWRVTMRHSWDGSDASVLDGVWTAAKKLAQQVADKRRNPVYIYARSGYLIDSVWPRE